MKAVAAAKGISDIATPVDGFPSVSPLIASEMSAVEVVAELSSPLDVSPELLSSLESLSPLDVSPELLSDSLSPITIR